MEEQFMKVAIDQAQKAYKNGDIPVGAVIVKDNKIIARSYNKREKTKNAINHAEILAIKKACTKLGDWRLTGCTLFVTLEPCTMCMGAVTQARIKKVIYGTKNLNKKINIKEVESKKCINIDTNEKCSVLLKKFFEDKRD
jgi:tRNA(adenine34) deaminase